MGILSRISQVKAKFRGIQRAIEGGHREQALSEAKKLGITTEQIHERKLKEKQKYREVYEKERMKQIGIQAKEKARQGPSIQRFARGLKRTIDASKTRGEVRQKDIFGSGKGLDFGGNRKETSPPKKKKQIIIDI